MTVETQARLRDVLHTVAPHKDLPADDGDLFATGVLDSFATIELIVALERTFHLTLPNEELTLQNFQTVSSIAALVDRLRT
ncbi:acyl carrier protein [Bradyrhizobium sp. LB12.1]